MYSAYVHDKMTRWALQYVNTLQIELEFGNVTSVCWFLRRGPEKPGEKPLNKLNPRESNPGHIGRRRISLQNRRYFFCIFQASGGKREVRDMHDGSPRSPEKRKKVTLVLQARGKCSHYALSPSIPISYLI